VGFLLARKTAGVYHEANGLTGQSTPPAKVAMKDTATPKNRRKSDDTLWASRSEQILDTAARLFARHGYHEVDTQLLADELEIGKGTLYRYFPSKQDLFLAAVDRVMRRLRQQIDDSIVSIEDPLDRIAVAIRTYLAFFQEHPDCAELIMQERAQFKDRKEPTYFQHRKASVERWRELYRSLIYAGRLREMPVERITDTIGNLVYGTMYCNYFTGNQKPPEVQAQEILDIVFHGILSDDERKRRQSSPASSAEDPKN
jgi:AcrR family transcriptional regulator